MSLAWLSQAILRVQMLLFLTFAPSDKWQLRKAAVWVSACFSALYINQRAIILKDGGKSVVREGVFVAGLTLQINIK